MTTIAFQDGKIVMRDGKVGTEQACCCQNTICNETCGWPRFLSVTVSGFPDGYFWASLAGGVPPAGGGFEPACGAGANAGDPQVRVGGSAVGLSRYTSTRYRDFNATFVAEYVEGASCTCPQWYGEIEVARVSGASGVPATECSSDLAGMLITLCQRDASTQLTISPPPDGGGEQATGSVTEVTNGAITGVSITSPGAGYAYLELERVQPTIEATVWSMTGSGAVLAVTLQQGADYNGDAIWSVASVAVTSAGSGYSPYDTVEFTVTDGEWPLSGAEAVISLARQSPTLGVQVSTAGGTGAQFSVSLSQTTGYFGETVWTVQGVTVTNGGSGYGPSDTVNIDAGSAVVESPAYLGLTFVRGEPVIEAQPYQFSIGTGAELAVTLSQTTDYDGKTAWAVSAVAVVNGGSGYTDGEPVTFSATDGTTISGASATLAADANGVITGITVTAGGLFYRDTDEIESVDVYDGGQYYATDGSIESITVSYGGEYFKEQPTGNIIVNTPTVTAVSNAGGRDAVITATVDSDPQSATFGQVLALTIDNGGQGYAITGKYWTLEFRGFGLQPLDGSLYGAEGTYNLTYPTELCQGQDLSGAVGLLANRVDFTACGESLLAKTYDAYYFAQIFPSGIANMGAGAQYALKRSPFSVCDQLSVVDWGGGPMTVAISPQ